VKVFEGKRGLILGVANDRSIAWAIAKEIMDQGGVCAFTYLPDKPDDDRQKNRNRVQKCLAGYEASSKLLVPLDVRDDAQIAQIMGQVKESLGRIDFLLHSIAFADRADLLKETIETSREGFLLAMEISVFSFLSMARAARPLMSSPGSMVTMTYFGGERCVPGYNVMGICKAALDASMRYLAYDLGPQQIRVNAISAGPLKTLASSAVGAGDMLQLYEHMSPMGRNISHEEVGRVGAFLLSDLSSGITGEIMHVDAGYNMMGSPGRLLDRVREARNG
jgi:enoyl-[acyl-carrier protein] reductase I